MTERCEIEMVEPNASQCDCCGGLTVRLTRYVYRDGDAFAVYYARYSNNHQDNELAMLVSLGEWGEGSEPSQRAAFYCRVRPTSDSYQVSLGDAAQSVWSEAKIVGAKLSREEALAHPLKSTAFEVLDEAFLKDRSLRGFLDRSHCGDVAIPLERNFQFPDEIFALSQESKTRAEAHRNFASLDGNRFFIRCLLPIPVEGYDLWNVGLWVEVSRVDFTNAQAAWNDADQYRRLRFEGRIANDVRADLELPVTLGNEVYVHVPDSNNVPKIETPKKGALGELMSKTWPKADFEKYAVARGLL